MSDRNIEKEISYDYYRYMEDGNDTKTISYPALIGLLGIIFNKDLRHQND